MFGMFGAQVRKQRRLVVPPAAESDLAKASFSLNRAWRAKIEKKREWRSWIKGKKFGFGEGKASQQPSSVRNQKFIRADVEAVLVKVHREPLLCARKTFKRARGLQSLHPGWRTSSVRRAGSLVPSSSFWWKKWKSECVRSSNKATR